MKEDKIYIAQKLLELLRETRAFSDLVSLEYEKTGSDWYSELLVLTYENGTVKKVNITGDSGVAILIDLLKQTGYLREEQTE